MWWATLVSMWPGPNHPYQDLPALPPPEKVETPRTFKAVVRASRKLAALDISCQRLPDPSTLINTIPLLEAQASTEIENIVTTNDELFRAAHDASPTEVTPATKEALRYRSSLHAGHTSLSDRPLTTETALIVCSELLDQPARIRDQPGTYIGSPATQTRIYTPPVGKAVITQKLSDWERFIHDHDDLDPLIVMALQHYQFEAIHPFFDGNGRTGRILNLLCLNQHGLLKYPVLYLSGYFVRTKEQYYQGLRDVTEHNQWENWIEYVANAVQYTAEGTLALVDQILAAQTRVAQRIADAGLPQQANVLAALLTERPYLRIHDVVNAQLAERQTASRWLRTLTEQRILTREQIGRSAIFIHTDLLNTLFGTDLLAETTHVTA